MKISFLADHPHESSQIAKWYFDEWSYLSPKISLEMVHEKVLEKTTSRNNFPLSFVAHDDQELTGVIELKFRENKNYPEYTYWLGGVFVSPKYRGRGIASMLIEKGKSHSATLGVKPLYLQCESQNVGLYQKHGFKKLHQAQHHDISTTIMCLE